MSQDQNAGRIHSIKTDNSSFERVEEFKLLGTTLTHQNSIQEENKSSLKSKNVSYHLVQDLCQFSIQKYKDLDIQNTILPVVSYR